MLKDDLSNKLHWWELIERSMYLSRVEQELLQRVDMNEVPVLGKWSHRIRFGVFGRLVLDGWSGVRHEQTCKPDDENAVRLMLSCTPNEFDPLVGLFKDGVEKISVSWTMLLGSYQVDHAECRFE